MRRLLPSGRAVSVSFENHGALGLTFKENAGVYRLEISQYLSTNQGPKDLQPGALRPQDSHACPTMLVTLVLYSYAVGVRYSETGKHTVERG